LGGYVGGMMIRCTNDVVEDKWPCKIGHQIEMLIEVYG